MAPRGGALGFSPRLIRYYLPQTSAEANFSGGLCRDVPPSSIPSGFVYDDVDWNLDRPGVAYYRGPIKAFGSTFAGAPTDTPSVFISVPTLNNRKHMLVEAWDGHLYDVGIPTLFTSTVDLGALNVFPVDRPKVYPSGGTIGDVLVIPAGDGVTPPHKVWDSGGTTTLGTLGGSPPPGKLCAVHQTYLVLAGTPDHPNRLYFMPASGLEDPWNTSANVIDTTYPITAIASVQGVLLVFSQNFCERVIGDTPPGNVNENMTLQALGSVGCSDPLSIQTWGTNIIFANQKGIYVSNGAGFDSLTDKPNGTGISSFWGGLGVGGLRLVGSMYNQKFYIMSVGSGFECMVCYLPTKSWWRFSTLRILWSDTQADVFGADELFHIGTYGGFGNRVFICSKMFHPALQGGDDVPPGGPAPILTTRMIGQGLGLKAFEHGHVTLSCAAGLNVAYIKGVDMEGIGSGLGFLIRESPLVTGATPGSPQVQRKRFTLNFDGQGIYMSVQRQDTTPPIEAQILAVEVEVRDATYGTISDAVYP